MLIVHACVCDALLRADYRAEGRDRCPAARCEPAAYACTEQLDWLPGFPAACAVGLHRVCCIVVDQRTPRRTLSVTWHVAVCECYRRGCTGSRASTSLNRQSSRSHMVMSLRVETMHTRWVRARACGRTQWLSMRAETEREATGRSHPYAARG
jgi:hypothetical protein